MRAARRLASVVIVFMHWGTEGEACPDPNQLSLAPKLAAAGASIIVGAHAHMLQGSGWLGHTFVAYGMGNFLWWERSYSTATGVLELTLHPHAPLTARSSPRSSPAPASRSLTGAPRRGGPPRITPACARAPSWRRGHPDRRALPRVHPGRHQLVHQEAFGFPWPP